MSAEYVGLTKDLFGDDSCKVPADFPDSGGIFTNAEVTYRGVTVGRVGQLRLIKKGVRVDLDIDDCQGSRSRRPPPRPSRTARWSVSSTST